MASSPFALQKHLDLLYAERSRHLALNAQTLKEFSAWQSALRGELLRRLGLAGRSPGAVAAERVQVDECDAYTEEKYWLGAGEGVQIPFYLLLPHRPPPYRAVLVFHGHEPGAAGACLGHSPERQSAAGDNYAQRLARAGYLVGVVEQRGLGERLTDQVEDASAQRSCRHLAFSYLLQGRTLLGERCWDGLCAASFLLARSDVVAGRLGCTGHSAGGATALWLAAIDERIRVLVVSGYFSSFRASILARRHCECNYVPGVLDLIEMGELAALLAPRPLCALNGAQDELFPLAAATGEFERVRTAYALLHASEACALAVHPGGHSYAPGPGLDWFARWL